MKLLFFLLAFCLISASVYFSWVRKNNHDKDPGQCNIVIRSDGFEEEIHYSGKIQLNDDESGFRSISPGGYFRFKKNEVSVKAESDLKGEIGYTIFNGSEQLNYNGTGKDFVGMAIGEMIAWGFDADNRMERLYRKGGNTALLSAIDSLKSDPVKVIYLNKVFKDSASSEDITKAIGKIDYLGTASDRAQFLRKIGPALLSDSTISTIYFSSIDRLGDGIEITNTLHDLLEKEIKDSLIVLNILQSTAKLSPCPEQTNIYMDILSKDLTNGSISDTLVRLISLIPSDIDKSNLYHKFIQQESPSESEWQNLMAGISSVNSDPEKANLLVQIAGKMPKSDILKTTYLHTARAIKNDMDYGRTVRAID